jgi:predicted RNase H-like HicB family nuclease
MDHREETIKSYLKKPYRRVLIPVEEGGFSAEVLEFPGCLAIGETAAEALANLEEVAEDWLRAALEQGYEIPAPSENDSYSGRFALRLPRDLHRQSALKAVRAGVSLNTCFVSAIAAWVGADNLAERLVSRVHDDWSRYAGTLVSLRLLLSKADLELGSRVVTTTTSSDPRVFVVPEAAAQQ